MRNTVRALRQAQGWSQGDLAERLSVSRQSVNAVENGRYIPSLPLALKIGRLFAIPVEAIFEDDDGQT